MNRGTVKRVGDQRVDVQLNGSAATLSNVFVTNEIDTITLAVGDQVLVDQVNGRHVVLATLGASARNPVPGSGSVNAPAGSVVNNALLADGSVPLTGNLAVTPGVMIDGYDISVLGQAIDNLQAADSVARTGHTVLTHASHLVATIGPDDNQVLIRHAIFADKETLVVSDSQGNVEFMRVQGQPQPAVDDRGAPCWRYTVTRRTQTSPAGIVTGWAAATLVNGLTMRGYISVDARNNSPAAPNLRFVMHTDIDAGTTEQIVRLGNVRGILGNGNDDYGFAVGRLTTGDKYLSYNYSRNLLALRGADIEVSDPAGVPVFRVWAIPEGDHDAGDTRLGKASGGHIETGGSEVNFFAGSQRIMFISPAGARFRGMIWSGTQPGPQVGIGEENGQGLIAARNAAGVGQFVVRTGDENVHVHMGNPVTEGGYAQFADGEFTTDGVIRARAFELLGGGTIGPGVVLTNAGKFTAGAGNNVAVIDGEHATWRIYAGHATPASAPFRVNQAGEAWLTNAHISGEVAASSGSIGGWTINSGYLGATNVGLAPADYPIFAGSTYANRASAPFRVTPAGALTATSGAVGGWTLGANSLTGGSATLHNSGYLSLGTGNDIARLDAADATYRLWAGHATAGSAPFRVTKTGQLIAADATVTGTIYAAAGYVYGSLYVGSANPRIHIDGWNKRIESTNFASGTSGFRIEGETGNAEFNNITARGAIASAIFTYNQIQATAGEIVVAKGAGKLRANFTATGGSGTMTIEDPPGISHAAAGGLWLVNDIVRMKDPGVGDSWFRVLSVMDQATHWSLLVQWQAGNTSVTFQAATAVINYGQYGQGIVRISATGSYSPYVSVATHYGSPWASLAEKARLGNLDGNSGASGYGLWTDNGYFTGTVQANAGYIGGWTIDTDKLYSGDVGMIPGEYPFYAGSSKPSDAPFRVTPSGELFATAANIEGHVVANSGGFTGSITALDGSIGGWLIGSGYMVAGSDNVGMSPGDYPFYSGATYNNRASAPFRVDTAGGLYATAGSVAGFTISYTEGLYSGTGATRVQMKPGSGFWAGATARDDAPFRVTNAGVLTATNVNISAGGGDVTLNSNGLRMSYSVASTANVSWYSGSTLKAYLASFSDGGTNTLRINVQGSGNLQVNAGYTKFDGKIRVTGGILQYGGNLAFFSTNPVDEGVSKQTVTGSRGGNAALASLLTALAAYGLITNSTTA